MTCRHQDPVNNPQCSSFETPAEQVANAEESLAELREKFNFPAQPDYTDFEVLDYSRHGNYMAVKVRYPSCRDCAFGGTKVMVFYGVREIDVMRWKKIDPHFRGTATEKNAAPSPIARFPGTDEGMSLASQFMAWRSTNGVKP